jgi:hypothetical protein
MDELSLMEVPEPSSLSSSNGVFMFQQVAPMRENLIKGIKWDDIAREQKEKIFTMTDTTDPDLIKMAELYSNDLSENILDPPTLS